MEKEKDPVDLFPTEPTDEGTRAEETLNPGFKGLIGLTRKTHILYALRADVRRGKRKKASVFTETFFHFLFMRKAGLEPARSQ